MWKAMLN
ncbi:hypothetical protein LINPERPRIM_LOCUS29259 [Linum perenne]